ncbi:MAG: hypothetical protein MAG581_02659 [Deltaproteobacteria bacterium]|jgi:flagellar biosynthesis/type III secretory pathway chaperone|nr:hypothetical protein [Deltaproteobacteria bacterium]
MIELLNNLQQQAELHENLLSLLQNESGGFGRLRGSELLKLQGEKSRCIRAAAQLEKERIQLVKQYAKSWNTDSKELTLSVIIDRSDEEYSVPLQQCFDQLKLLIGKIRDIAEENAMQASGRLKSVESSLQFISQLQNGPPTYSEAGKIQKRTGTLSRTEV